MSGPVDYEALTHSLILPRDENHHGTFIAGVLLSFALEAAYATAYRAVGLSANLLLKRELDLRGFEPVSIGTVVEIRGREIQRARAQVVVGRHDTPLYRDHRNPWLDGAMQFVQVNENGRPEPLVGELIEQAPPLELPWLALRKRALKLLSIRS